MYALAVAPMDAEEREAFDDVVRSDIDPATRLGMQRIAHALRFGPI